jgi:hypothetical protein
MPQGKPKALSPLKWMLGVGVFVVVIAGSIMLGNWLSPRNSGAPLVAPAASPIIFVIFLVLGGAAFVVGLAGYTIALATRCFTFNFDRPFFPAYRRKMWFVNFVVGFFLQAGFGMMMFPTASRLLAPLLPSSILLPVSFFLPFIIAQLILIWFTPWAPLDRSIIRRRMEAMGIVPAQLDAGQLMGISNPARTSFKKMTRIEDDVGVLWISPDALVYLGDQQSLNIPRARMEEVERKADAGSTSAYFGAVHVIVRYRDENGAEQRVRLHPEVNWTMTAAARAQDALAERLESWRISPDTLASGAALAAATGGFPVAEQPR